MSFKFETERTLRDLARQGPPPESFWQQGRETLSKLGFPPDQVEEILQALKDTLDQARERERHLH